ncbi:NADH:flavin oxidoreductases, Old Yellow Enzyme family [Actinacidiphila bryophytorum]|uniref:NADH:flavin oxidoreductases, Old Yellow Enzyme family n=1 Tax=Actinacidiphila bryophytorum TaxID=1436133 RepID=A0A9W4GY95_9ACTN|nr:NADH:flavin oxidoreductases, Old Yellow Enzyme family [Actinacidiphila bryophytorum]
MPVQRRAHRGGHRHRERLALHAPRLAGGRRHRADPHRGHCGQPRGPHHPLRPRHLERHAGRGLPPGDRLPQGAGHRHRYPARPRRPQGVHRAHLGGPRRTDPARRAARLDTGRPEPGPLRACLDRARGADRGRHTGDRRAVRRRRPQGAGRRLPGRGDPRRPRLPAAPVPLPLHQPPHRRLRRLLREPHPLPAGGGRGGARGLAAGPAGALPDLGHRLAQRERRRRPRGLDGRRHRGLRQGAGRPRGGPDGRLDRRQRPRRPHPGGSRLPGALRRAGARGGRHAGGRGRSDHRGGAGRGHRGLGPRRRCAAGPPAAARPVLRPARGGGAGRRAVRAAAVPPLLGRRHRPGAPSSLVK